MAAPHAPPAVTTLARDTSPGAIAVDATWVYWADQAGNIERVAK